MSEEKKLEPYISIKEVIKIRRFIKSLILKNEKEFQIYSTPESEEAYLAYRSARLDFDGVGNYNFTNRQLLQYGFNENSIAYIRSTPRVILLKHFDEFKKFNKILRDDVIRNYVELNAYIAQFQGVPINKSQILYVENLDDENATQKIPIHELTKKDYPVTYNYYFIKGHINKIIIDFPTYIYLNYIEKNKRIDSFKFSEFPAWHIIKYDEDIYNDEEMYFVHKSLFTARELLVRRFGKGEFSKKYDYLAQIMYIEFCTHFVKEYFSSFMKKYSLGIYTREEINNIFKSNGFNDLCNIESDELANTVVFYLDILKANIASNDILDIVYKILDDDTLTIYRLFLAKEYRMNEDGETDIDYSKPVDYNQNLIIDKVLVAGSQDYAAATILDYNDVTDIDPTWSGYDPKLDNELTIEKKIREYQNSLLASDLYRQPTKYIILNKIVNIYESNKKMSEIYSLMLQFNLLQLENSGGFQFDSDFIKIAGNIVASPMSIYAALVYLNLLKIFKSVNYAKNINYSNLITVNGIMLQSFEEMNENLQEVLDTELVISSTHLNKKVSDYISLEECLTAFPYFNIDSSTTLNDVLYNIDSDVEKLNDFEKLFYNKTTEDEYQAFKMIFDSMTNSYNYSALYDDCTDYITYIQIKSNSLYVKMESLGVFDPSQPINIEIIDNLATVLASYYFDYLNQYLTGYAKFGSDGSADESNKYLNDVKIILNSFISIFCATYNSEFKINLSDAPYNKLMMRDFVSSMYGKLYQSDTIVLKDAITKSFCRFKLDSDTIELKDIWNIISYYRPSDTIELWDEFTILKARLFASHDMMLKDDFNIRAKIKFEDKEDGINLRDSFKIKER